MPYTVTILTHNDYFKDQFTTTETRVFDTKEDAYKLAALRYMDEIHDWDDFTEDDALLLLQGKVKEFVDLMENHSHFDGEYIPRRVEISVWGKTFETETLEGEDLEKYEKALKELARFGRKITETFHGKLKSLFAPHTLRQLGSLVFLEAAQAFDPELADVKPAARLEVAILAGNAPADWAQRFLDGKAPEPSYVAVSQPVVSLPE